MGYICIILCFKPSGLTFQIPIPLSGGLMEEGFGKLHNIQFVQPQKSAEDCTITS